MDTNNNSNETQEMEQQQALTNTDESGIQIKQENEEIVTNSKNTTEIGDSNDDARSERLELYVKYDDMLGQESGTQTPIEDENPGSNEADDSLEEHKNSSATNNNTNTDNRLNSKSDVICVKESEDDDSESIEIELESDNSLLFTSLTSLFPDATGLKYRHPETNTLRGVKLADGKFMEPLDGWSAVQNYICVFNRGNKRKNDEDEDSSKKLAKIDTDRPMGTGGSDLVVLGLPWTTTEETMRSYFEQYGEVNMVQVKTDPKSGKSRGFGFVQFAKSSIQNKLLSMRHFIDGRWCDVKVPLSKAEAEATKAAQLSRKIFVGRLPDNITTDDLRNHFSDYGTLTDVFIPKPFRNFAFVTFGTSDMAQSIFKHKHVIKGSPVTISEAIPKDNGPNNFGNAVGGGYVGGGPQNNTGNPAYAMGGYGSGGMNKNIHPFNNPYQTHQGTAHHYHSKNNVGGNFGGNLYQNSRKMHMQSTYYQMPSHGNSGPSSGVDSGSYVNHSAHSDYGNFGAATGGYSQPSSSSINGGQYYKMQQQQQQQQQQPIMTPNQNHSTYPNQSSYSSHGSNFSRGSYGSVWK